MKSDLIEKVPARSVEEVTADFPLISEADLHYFNEGSHLRLYQKLGAHPLEHRGRQGTCFAVWAPNAKQVSVFGDFNHWNKESHLLSSLGSSGIWKGFIPGVKQGDRYKYHIRSRSNDYQVDKADPFGFCHEQSPRTASVVCDLEYAWNDRQWMSTRGKRQQMSRPMSIYEMHLGSWMRVEEEGNRFLNYRELAPKLAGYLQETGFTHVEFLPLMEHPFYGSWGYQTTGYFAPTSRYGTPQDLMFLIDCLHQHGIGVILDWVPSHFPTDEHGLAYFDGTHLFEHADLRQGFHPDWNSYIFNYGRHEVRSFLLSSAFLWLDKYHVDGLRVDAVASMLYLDYSRREGEWIPNQYGGRESLEAIDFLRRFNEEIYRHYPDVQTMAEESTAWPMVSRPNYVGGLGFGYKWDMGWMHDTLKYLSRDPLFRKYHHNEITFRSVYAFSENYVLPLSHDEVVHGKGSLLGKMPGDDWRKFAQLRLLLGHMYAQPGKKLLFMGGEFGQWKEWNHDSSLDWKLLELPLHSGLKRWLSELNLFYQREPAMHEADVSPEGFSWVDASDAENSALSWLRISPSREEIVLAALNFTPVPRLNYHLGVPHPGYWKEMLNSDAREYGGSGHGNFGGVSAIPLPSHGRSCSLTITLPPLAVVFFKWIKGE
jgi:1,4-alpha-glucan branching enzyme